jgi:hypothetical protein
LSVLETATADDTGPGSATVRDGTGAVVRLAVGRRLDGGAILTGVSDDTATFQQANDTVVLSVSKPPASAVSYRAARHRE